MLCTRMSTVASIGTGRRSRSRRMRGIRQAAGLFTLNRIEASPCGRRRSCRDFPASTGSQALSTTGFAQVGNAVPPTFSAYIACFVLDALLSGKRPGRFSPGIVESVGPSFSRLIAALKAGYRDVARGEVSDVRHESCARLTSSAGRAGCPSVWRTRESKSPCAVDNWSVAADTYSANFDHPHLPPTLPPSRQPTFLSSAEHWEQET